MAYDPCGTPKLEGKDILKRLAAYLEVPENDLKTALIIAVNTVQGKQTNISLDKQPNV